MTNRKFDADVFWANFAGRLSVEKVEDRGIIEVPEGKITLPYVMTSKKATPLKPPKNKGDLGIDLFSAEEVVISPFSNRAVSTGIAIAFPTNFGAIIKPRSRNAFLIGSGVIDAGYRGEIFVKVINYMPDSLVIRDGYSLGQMILQRVYEIEVFEVDADSLTQKEWEDTERGTSSGHKRTSS